jgi:hypothetical protein
MASQHQDYLRNLAFKGYVTLCQEAEFTHINIGYHPHDSARQFTMRKENFRVDYFAHRSLFRRYFAGSGNNLDFLGHGRPHF